MTSPEQRQSPIEIPEEPPIADKLAELVNSPDDIEPAANLLGAPPFLLNFHMAAPLDMSLIGLGKGLFVPLQIGRGKGGRKSLHFLRPGERSLLGMFVTSEGLALQYLTRETGSGGRAETGDIYSWEITTREGKSLFKGSGTLEVIDASKGHSRLGLEVKEVGEEEDVGAFLVCRTFSQRLSFRIMKAGV